jgi:Photosystem I psaA/psaB protein
MSDLFSAKALYFSIFYDARGSKLMSDKKDFGFHFPCDGPGRGFELEQKGLHFMSILLVLDL